MKKLLLMAMVAIAHTTLAQDILQKLYSPDLVMKYREEVGLSTEQVKKIRKIYNGDLAAYNDKRWELDAAMVKLEQLISQSTVDAKAADAQLDKSLALENEIKKMKLAMLLKVKNMLTPEQQARLDKHKDEPVNEGIFTAQLADKRRMVFRVKPGLEPSEKPLYIVEDKEGKEQRMEDDKLNDVDPADIESIEVLKGESAIKIYGKRGANGVIVIKVKKKK
jgi:TonB-dependent SusC/RagA subfamily outer membrane receptor